LNANTIKENRKAMNLNGFKEMIGLIGNFELSERIFAVIDRNQDQVITLEEFLVYNDILTNGSQDEKMLLTFKMIDVNENSGVEYSEFK